MGRRDDYIDKEYTVSASHYVCLFIIVVVFLICFSVTYKNMTDNPIMARNTVNAPALSLRCREGLFVLENSVTGVKVPLMSIGANNEEQQVMCTQAYEAIRTRTMMGRQ